MSGSKTLTREGDIFTLTTEYSEINPITKQALSPMIHRANVESILYTAQSSLKVLENISHLSIFMESALANFYEQEKELSYPEVQGISVIFGMIKDQVWSDYEGNFASNQIIENYKVV